MRKSAQDIGMRTRLEEQEHRMPAPWRAALTIVLAALIGGGLLLIAIRGPAMLVDMAQAAWAMLCL